jgi:hypothetical protein
VSGRLVAWIGIVAVMASINFSANFTGSAPESDSFYDYDFALTSVVVYGLFLGIVAALATRRRDLLALNEPRSWPAAAGGMFVVLLVTYGVAYISYKLGLDPGEEQGITPDELDEERVYPFLASTLAVVVAAPLAEELLFRGVGYSLLRQYGVKLAIVAIGVAFALTHGLVEAFPILFVLGAALAWLRERTGSVYPGMILHGLFNGLAVVFSVAT